MNRDDSGGSMAALEQECRIQAGLPAAASRSGRESFSRWRTQAGVRRLLGLVAALVVLAGATTLLLSRGSEHVPSGTASRGPYRPSPRLRRPLNASA